MLSVNGILEVPGSKPGVDAPEWAHPYGTERRGSHVAQADQSARMLFRGVVELAHTPGEG